MKLTILSFSGKQPAWVLAGFDDYIRRLPSEYKLELRELKPEARSPSMGGGAIEKCLALEAVRLRATIADKKPVIALDEKGQDWTTERLAEGMRVWRNESGSPCFVIGSADGLDSEFKRSADLCIRLSAMTLPHGLVRVVLAEQIYRASAIIAGHPYHRV